MSRLTDVVGIAATHDDAGYWLVGANGAVHPYGDAVNYGSLTRSPAAPIVGIAATPGGGVDDLVTRDGGVFTYGDAVFAGSVAGYPLVRPVVGHDRVLIQHPIVANIGGGGGLNPTFLRPPAPQDDQPRPAGAKPSRT